MHCKRSTAVAAGARGRTQHHVVGRAYAATAASALPREDPIVLRGSTGCGYSLKLAQAELEQDPVPHICSPTTIAPVQPAYPKWAAANDTNRWESLPCGLRAPRRVAI
ncbi:hypothetical protein OAO87_02020 [bacterium]|nr:hypothetical protein [bacterium]